MAADTAAASSSVTRATVVGTILQVAMVVAGHYIPAVKEQFALGGMSISAVAGFLATRGVAGASVAGAAKGGVIAGGVSAFLGILVSTLLKDVPSSVLGFGTAGSAVTGVIGGLLGRFVGQPRS